MKRKFLAFIILILLLLFRSEAQHFPSFYPFKGFNVGITGQAQFIQKSSFIALIGTDPAPKGRWTSGWDAGIEFSYHFAKYFGVAIGINYGTIFSYERAIDISNYPNPDFMKGKVNRYHSSVSKMYNNAMFFPIKLEFHYPLRKDLFFVAEIGIKVKGIFQRLAYGKEGWRFYSTGLSFVTPDDYDPDDDAYNPKTYYADYGWRDMSKIYCDLFLGIGLYYKLPYGDLLRFTAGVNMSFHNIIEGYYRYYLTESYGTFAVKHDFIYTQLAYIHTLNFQKAKRYLKKQEYSFSSKKERRKKIIELLDNW
jgi:hypothetical protein